MVRKHDFEKTFQYLLNTKRGKIGDNISSMSLRNIMCYTDGSKIWEGTGAGVFGLRTKYSEVTEKFPRIFLKEVHAIDIICARAKLERGYNEQSIAFMSESQAAIQALIILSSGRGWYGSADRDLTCWHVTLHWVPWHRGKWKSRRQMCLREKECRTPVEPEPFCGLADAFLKEELKIIMSTKRGNSEGTNKDSGKKVLGGWNFKRFRACIGISKTRL